MAGHREAPFTEDEDRILLHGRRRNAPFSDIAKCLGRSAHSCHTRYDVLIEQQERKRELPPLLFGAGRFHHGGRAT